MKVQLVVVVGKPEGKIIPLPPSQFKIGRGEGCQLRPNNDQISREHAMFEVTSDAVFIQDLGSRNGTEVNGKRLNAHDPYRLKNGELVRVGPLTFAVAIEGGTAVAVAGAGSPSKKIESLDDVSHDDIGSWLVSDASKEPPDRPSGVYGGETLTIAAFKAKDRPASSAAMPTAPVPTPAPAVPVAKASVPVVKAPEPVPEPDPEPEPVDEAIPEYREDDGIEDLSELTAEADPEEPEEFVDESNPFYVKKPTAGSAAPAVKEDQKDSSDMAHDILRRMMDRRRASKSS